MNKYIPELKADLPKVKARVTLPVWAESKIFAKDEFNGIHEFLLEHSLSAKGKRIRGDRQDEPRDRALTRERVMQLVTRLERAIEIPRQWYNIAPDLPEQAPAGDRPEHAQHRGQEDTPQALRQRGREGRVLRRALHHHPRGAEGGLLDLEARPPS